MFDVAASRLAWIPVRWFKMMSEGDEAARRVEQSVELKVEILDRDEFKEWFVRPADKAAAAAFDKVSEVDRFKHVVKAWRGVVNHGTPLPFEDQYIAALLKSPGFGQAFNGTYGDAWMGVEELREGNSESSPVNGPPAVAS